MRYLAQHYCVLSTKEVLELIAKGIPAPPRSVLVTFDDGYRDFAEHAWPEMQKLGLPAVVFVATAYPGDPSAVFWWDRLHQGLLHTDRQQIAVDELGTLSLGRNTERATAYDRIAGMVRAKGHDEAMMLVDEILDRLGVSPERGDALLGWDEIRRLMAEGVTFAAHTQTHPILTRVPLYQARMEARGALVDLDRELGDPLPILCYPDGKPYAFDQRIMQALREDGIVAAFTTVRGINRVGKTSPLAFHRSTVGFGASFSMFRLSLTSLGADLKAHFQTRAWQSLPK
jgi:peptidoglycan/xylan/chitin deacetylase (PgdA/CDA1 family)